jgi:hypothetical protein
VGGNSEVELLDNSLASLEIRLWRGTAIVEATGADGVELNIGVSTPHTRVAIVRQGLYRLHVIPDDATELIVRKGRVILSDSQKVKGGNKIVFSATNTTVAKLGKDEKKQKDEVEVWSKERAETLAKANRKITDRMLSSAFASFWVLVLQSQRRLLHVPAVLLWLWLAVRVVLYHVDLLAVGVQKLRLGKLSTAKRWQRGYRFQRWFCRRFFGRFFGRWWYLSSASRWIRRWRQPSYTSEWWRQGRCRFRPRWRWCTASPGNASEEPGTAPKRAVKVELTQSRYWPPRQLLAAAAFL